ncbi:MAG: VanZ family protein [Thiobacillaceae bacterium]|nr:VanZ family protein [Thiobacillaceae bacterium]MCX7672035.1 VanZ family protein [Thiobacillaceae bacterium]MDW8323729.1 hypothetical protein [Burkholderiales bacterium]
MGAWRRLWWLTGGCMVLAVVYFSLIPSPPEADLPHWDKLNHLAAYAGLAWWFAQLGLARTPVALALLALGGAVELAQGLIPSRQAGLADMGANVLGVGLGLALAARLPNALLWLEARRA